MPKTLYFKSYHQNMVRSCCNFPGVPWLGFSASVLRDFLAMPQIAPDLPAATTSPRRVHTVIFIDLLREYGIESVYALKANE